MFFVDERPFLIVEIFRGASLRNPQKPKFYWAYRRFNRPSLINNLMFMSMLTNGFSIDEKPLNQYQKEISKGRLQFNSHPAVCSNDASFSTMFAAGRMHHLLPHATFCLLSGSQTTSLRDETKDFDCLNSHDHNSIGKKSMC